jgi:ABC-type branched-subunit amino acid transport system ATPase component/ABC-type branched-subunit amino acid transport system permease subunit
VIAFDAPQQVLADGAVNGLVYALLAMGLVIVYRSTRVINFAVAAIGLPGAMLTTFVAVQYGIPTPLAWIVGLLAGATLGATAELIVVRRLFTAPRVILLVATIGLSQVALAITISLPKADVLRPVFPQPIGGSMRIGDVALSGAAQTIIIVVPLVAACLGWLLTRTTFGKQVTAASDNPDLSRLSGISPKRASTIVWTIAGVIATLSMMLIAGRLGSTGQIATLGPATLARALAVFVIAGMLSFPRCLLAGLALGVIEAFIGYNFLDAPGLIESLLLIAVLIAVYFQSRRAEPEGASTFLFAAKSRPIPEAIRDRWWVRQHGRIIFVVGFAIAFAVPFIVTQPSRAYLYSSIVCMALVALSVTIVTGWAGQLSLGQMAFAGIGALGTAALVRGTELAAGLPGGRTVRFQFGPTSLPIAIIALTVICALVAAVIGAGALRVRGLLLGVSTFVFAYAAQGHLFRTELLTGGASPPIRLPRSTVAGIDLTDQRTYYWCVLGILAIIVATVARLRRRAPWRRMAAVRDNSATAAAYTVGATREKLVSFVLAGGLAGLAGGLLGALTQNINTNQLFIVSDSLDVVAIAVIGGLGTIAGPLLGALWVEGLPAFFPDNETIPLVASGAGLLVLLLYFPGGLVQIGYSARDALFAYAAARATPQPARVRPTTWTRPVREHIAPDAPAIDARGVVVNFGGVRAVDDATITVARGEVVGLIGTNGAGKSTLLNAIGGYVPAGGHIQVLGHDVTKLASHRRAALGLGRTFQAATLFPEMSVRQTVMVALEARRRVGVLSHALALPTAGRDEARKRSEADEIIDFLGLGRYADATISELSTGTRRIVELAGLLAVNAEVMCLDEPTAGVAQRETEAFGPLLLAIRRELDASILIIEHDMPLIMSMSDRVYCLEAGRVIAEGIPEQVRSNPTVVASYLGTDERAIARSDSNAAAAPTAPAPAAPTAS